MTKEESINLWKLEREHVESNSKHMNPSMKKLYDVVDNKIMAGELLYEDFANDMLDMVTTLIVEYGQTGEEPDRVTQVEDICNRLIKKYTKDEDVNDESAN